MKKTSKKEMTILKDTVALHMREVLSKKLTFCLGSFLDKINAQRCHNYHALSKAQENELMEVCNKIVYRHTHT